MRVYEIKAITINNYGETEKEVVARTINKDKINEIIRNFRKEKQHHDWWMDYLKNEDGNIEIEIDNYDVIE